MTRSNHMGGILLAMILANGMSFAESPRFGHVEKQGAGQANLILVPCLGCDWRAWDQFMARNEKRYTMYAVTWPGMGDTPMPDTSTRTGQTPHWDYILEAMTTLIREESIDRPVLIGHSAAGPYVVDFAVKYPKLVRSVVSVDATITNWDTYGFTPAQRTTWAEKEMKEVRDSYDNDAGWTKLNAAPKSIRDPDRRAFYHQMWLSPPRKHVLRYWEEWLKTDVGAVVNEVEVPLLAVYAIRKKDSSPEETKAKRRRRFERASVGKNVSVAFIHQAGHSIWEHQPAAFDAMIADFVAGRPVKDR